MHQLLRYDSDLCGYTASALVFFAFAILSLLVQRNEKQSGVEPPHSKVSEMRYDLRSDGKTSFASIVMLLRASSCGKDPT